MFKDIKAAIISLIRAEVAVNDSWVYDYEPARPEGYPAISVTAKSVPARFADTERNRREYTFRIRCYQERQTTGTQAGLVSQKEAERILTDLVDSMISVFDNYANYNLLNQVPNLVFVQPIPADWGYVNAPDIDMRIADINLVAVVLQ